LGAMMICMKIINSTIIHGNWSRSSS